MSGSDKVFVMAWYPVALAVAIAVPATPRWPTAVVWFLIGAVTWQVVLKVIKEQ